jgi:hypothetical protein
VSAASIRAASTHAASPSVTAAVAEELQEQQKDVKDVDEDVGREHDRLVVVRAAQPVEVDDDVDTEDRDPGDGPRRVGAGMCTKMSTIPAMISASSSQNSVR